MEPRVTNSRRMGDSTLLVSFCNVKENKPSVAAIDLHEENVEPRWIEIKGGAHLRGSRGLCNWNGLVCVAHEPGTKIGLLPSFAFLLFSVLPRFLRAARLALRRAARLALRLALRRPKAELSPGFVILPFLQAAHIMLQRPKGDLPPGFVFLDPNRDFKQVGEGELPSTPHSVCSKGGDLYFTMSGEDSVYKATLDSRSREWDASLYWTFPSSSGTKDENHVNAIEVVDGDLCISATGKKEKGSKLWSSAKRGFVYDIEHAEYIMHDIKQPHSLLEDSRTIWTCETRGSRMLSNKGDEYHFPGDYTWRVRGLAMNEDYFYVGVSKNRVGSKSQGTLRGYEGTCRIYRLAKGSNEPELLIDLSDVRDEIYELMLV